MASEFDFDIMHAVLNDDQKAGSLYMAAKQLADALDAHWRIPTADSVAHIQDLTSALRNALGLEK